MLHLNGALNRIAPDDLARAAARWEPEFKQLPRPWTALIVGGDSSSYRFDPEIAAELGSQASSLARELGGSLLVSTTPRTSGPATQALFDAISVPAYRYAFARDDDKNPYHGFLGLADRFIVTVDSASLPMEACATGRPVQVFEWPRKPSRGLRRSPGRDTGLGARIYEAAIEYGLVKPARDFDAYHRALRSAGLTSRLGEEVSAPAHVPDDLAATTERIRALFPGCGEPRGGSRSEP